MHMSMFWVSLCTAIAIFVHLNTNILIQFIKVTIKKSWGFILPYYDMYPSEMDYWKRKQASTAWGLASLHGLLTGWKNIRMWAVRELLEKHNMHLENRQWMFISCFNIVKPKYVILLRPKNKLCLSVHNIFLIIFLSEINNSISNWLLKG